MTYTANSARYRFFLLIRGHSRLELDYDALGFLEAVIRTGSFEAAAKSLNVTQSAVSQRIKLLEERVGCVLVVRGRPCLPTEDGLLLCQHTEQVSLMQYELAQRLGLSQDEKGAKAAHVRISVNSDSLATWFPSVLKRISNELSVLMEIIPDDQEFTEDRLRSGDALAVVTSNENAIPGAKLVPLGNMNYLAVCTSDYFAEYFRHEVSLETLSQAPTLMFDRKDTLPEQWLVKNFGESIVLPAHHVPSFEGLMSSCKLSVGWIMMPEISVRDSLLSGELLEIVPCSDIAVPLLWQCRSHSGELLAKLTEIVKNVATSEFQPHV